MARERLAALIAQLDDAGIEVASLTAVLQELEVIEAPPGFFGRVRKKVWNKARTQWSHVVGELQESGEMVGLLTRRIREPLAPEDADRVRAQMLDLMRVLPAGFIAAANWALPIPGTSVLTPWLLNRLGLMPSRWREAHVLHELRIKREGLLAEGKVEEAKKIEDIEQAIEAEADRREEARVSAELLTHWDANDNGKWDVEEVAAYKSEITRLQRVAQERGAQKRWFACAEGQVFGPMRLTELLGASVEAQLLVCYESSSAWVLLSDLRPRPDGPASGSS